MPAVTATVLSDGETMKPEVALMSIDIRREVDRIPQAELRVIDGSAAKREFPISDTKFFEPGAKIEIKLRYEGQDETSVFKGIVVRHGLEVSRDGSVLVVGVKDEAVKLTGSRGSAVFHKMTDSEIISKMVKDAGLTVGTIADTKPKHSEMVQYHCTPWDFILTRAEALGQLVSAEDGKLSLQNMEIKGQPKKSFEYGMDEILDLEIDADAGDQYKAVECIAWDLKQQAPTEPSKAKSVTLAPGNFDGGTVGAAVGNNTYSLSHPVPVTDGEMQAWADAEMARSRMGLLCGRLVVPGFGDIKLLDVIEIKGLGARFNGKTLVTGLRHRVDITGWRTDVQFGLSGERASQKTDLLESPAAGLLPGVSGLQIGVVADFEADPDNELRVKVILPCVDMKASQSVWARLATPDAGKARGYFFRPEPKDEVVIGFFNNDPRCPVILGALFGSKNTPPAGMEKPDDKNEKRGFVSKKGTKINFLDGDKPSVSIETPGGNKLVISDDDAAFSFTDKNKNTITMGKDGVVIHSESKLTIEGKDGVVIDGKTVDVK